MGGIYCLSYKGIVAELGLLLTLSCLAILLESLLAEIPGISRKPGSFVATSSDTELNELMGGIIIQSYST